MFTGIITHTGKVSSINDAKFRFEADAEITKQLVSGGSIAVDGVCMTAIATPNESAFDVIAMPETIRKTNFDELSKGDAVNLELPMPATGKLDGHIVQGHVDGKGLVESIVNEGNSRLLSVALPKDLSGQTVPKGSITINGVSLTIISKDNGSITVGLIPYTWENTALNTLKAGDNVNIELDVLARYAGQKNYVDSLISDRGKTTDSSTIKTAKAQLPTEFGEFEISVYKTSGDNKEHALLKMGDKLTEPVLCRVHSQCVTGDTFHSLKCDCNDQLHQSLEMIGKNKSGIIIYLNQEGRDIGLTNKIKAYALQETGFDTVEANQALGLPIDNRDYSMVADILKDQGIKSIKLITNNPNKVEQLESLGVVVSEKVSIHSTPQRHNKEYLSVKKSRLGHQLSDIS